jgi:hypothetical protein
MRRLRSRVPSPALVVSVVALVVALGGTSYAAFKIGTAQIKNGAVTNSKLAANAVGPAKIKNNGVTASKINTSGLTVPNDQTASNFTQSSPNQTITGTTVTIGSPIQITTTGTKRVFASAAVHAVNTTATGFYLVCRITIDATSGVNDTAFNQNTAPVDASVSPLAATVVGAGTHTVTLLCSSIGGNARVVDAALGTWAVAQ